MRAAYTVVALAAIGSVLVGAVVVSATAPPPSTVRAALGLDGPDAPGLAERQARAVASATAACMERAGLTYVAVPDPPPTIPDPTLEPVAWAERWGFGVSTSVGTAGATAVADPNAAHAASLAGAAADAYRTALFGRDGAGGCHGSANAAVHGLRERLLAPLRSELLALEAAIEADPGLVAARAAWRACVARATASLALAPSLLTRDRLPSSLLEAFERRARSAAGDPRALAGVQGQERRVAAAVARCEGRFAEDRSIVARPHEARFLRQHGTALRRIGRAIRDAEAALPGVPP